MTLEATPCTKTPYDRRPRSPLLCISVNEYHCAPPFPLFRLTWILFLRKGLNIRFCVILPNELMQLHMDDTPFPSILICGRWNLDRKVTILQMLWCQPCTNTTLLCYTCVKCLRYRLHLCLTSSRSVVIGENTVEHKQGAGSTHIYYTPVIWASFLKHQVVKIKRGPVRHGEYARCTAMVDVIAVVFWSGMDDRKPRPSDGDGLLIRHFNRVCDLQAAVPSDVENALARAVHQVREILYVHCCSHVQCNSKGWTRGSLHSRREEGSERRHQ